MSLIQTRSSSVGYVGPIQIFNQYHELAQDESYIIELGPLLYNQQPITYQVYGSGNGVVNGNTLEYTNTNLQQEVMTVRATISPNVYVQVLLIINVVEFTVEWTLPNVIVV